MKRVFHGIVLVLLAGLLCLSLAACASDNEISNPWTQEYVSGQGNIRGNVDTADFLARDERFEIGADQDGYAVFKDPEAALTALEEKYAAGIELIREEFGLEEFGEKTYEDYKTYGWQVTTGTEEEREQAGFVTGFLDIYENSFRSKTS